MKSCGLALRTGTYPSKPAKPCPKHRLAARGELGNPSPTGGGRGSQSRPWAAPTSCLPETEENWLFGRGEENWRREIIIFPQIYHSGKSEYFGDEYDEPTPSHDVPDLSHSIPWCADDVSDLSVPSCSRVGSYLFSTRFLFVRKLFFLVISILNFQSSYSIAYHQRPTTASVIPRVSCRFHVVFNQFHGLFSFIFPPFSSVSCHPW